MQKKRYYKRLTIGLKCNKLVPKLEKFLKEENLIYKFYPFDNLFLEASTSLGTYYAYKSILIIHFSGQNELDVTAKSLSILNSIHEIAPSIVVTHIS